MPIVYSDTLTHDAIQVWLQPPGRDVVGGVRMRTAPPPEVAETITVTEVVTVQVGLALAVFDDAPVTDGVELPLAIPVRVADLEVLGEAVEARQNVLLAAVFDDSPVTEGVTASVHLPGVLAVEETAVGEAVTLRSALAVEDTLTPTAVAVVQMPIQAVAADMAGPADAVELALNVLALAVHDTPVPIEVVGLLAPIVIQTWDETLVDERRNLIFVKGKKVRIRRPPQAQGGG